MKKTFIFFIAYLILLTSSESFSEDLKFLFTEDQNTVSENISDIVKSKNDISIHNWFKSPPTRIELLTFAIDQYFKKDFESNRSVYLGDVYKYFEESKSKIGVREEANVTFSKDADIFVVSLEIEGLGKPKKPMKEFCDKVIYKISRNFGGMGYSYQNTFLKPFITGSYEDPELLEIVDLLRNNFLIIVHLTSQYGGKERGYPPDHFIFRGYKLSTSKKIHYLKQTFSLEK